MSLLSINEAWVERVNKNLLPLLNKFSIRRQGPFGLSNVIQPIVNVETLEEVQAEAQQVATTTGTLAAVGSTIGITVPVGETWSVEFISAGSTGPTSGAHVNRLALTTAGVTAELTGDHPNSGVALLSIGISISFNPPLTIAAGSAFILQRVVLGASTPSTMIVFFRRL